jgi:capsular exopolysaccharide synthesis family protein
MSGMNSVGELLDVRHLYGLLLYRWWLVALAVGLGAAAALAYLFIQPKIYDSRALLQVEQADKKVLQIDEVREDNPSTLDFMNTVVQALTSRNLLLRVIDANKLGENQEFAPPRRDGRAYSTIELADLLENKVTVKLRRLTRLVEITVEDPDPVLARDMAASFVKEFLRENFRQRSSVSSVASDFLKEESDKLKRKLEESELKLQLYKEKNQAVSLEDRQNITVEKLREINTKVTEAKGERLRLESDMEQLKQITLENTGDLLRIRSVAEIPEVAETRVQLLAAQTELASLQERYGAKHTKHISAVQKTHSLQAALTENIAKAGDILQRQYDAALQTEIKLGEALKEQEQAALELNKLAIPFNVLQREVESDRAMYEAVVTRMKETAVAGVSEQAPYTLIEEPMVASKPCRPRVLRTIALALVLSSLCGVGLVVGLDRFDSSLRSVDQAEGYLNIPSLAGVPDHASKPALRFRDRLLASIGRRTAPEEQPAPNAAIERRNASAYPLATLESPGSALAESFRTLRAALTMLGPEETRRVVMFVSAVPEEGKTSISINTALVLAQQGHKTLLADFDLRRPSLHKALFPVDQAFPGITDHLSSSTPLAGLIKPTGIQNLCFLSAGTRSPNPAELLGSAPLGKMFTELLGCYDRIVIDSAPVNAVSDSLILAPHAQKIILVVRSGHVPRQAVQRALHLLRQSGAKVAGFVLNRLPTGRLASSYYYYYGGSYVKDSVYGQAPATTEA